MTFFSHNVRIETVVFSFRLTSAWFIVVAVLQSLCSKRPIIRHGDRPDIPSTERSPPQLLFGGIQELRYGEASPRVGFAIADGDRQHGGSSREAGRERSVS